MWDILFRKNITEKRPKWYGHVMRMKEKQIVRRMLDVDIPGKRSRGQPKQGWNDACNVTEAGLKEDNTILKQGIMEEENKQSTSDNGTCQQQRRSDKYYD